MSYLDDNAAAGRILLPDLVRAFALIGICLVNVGVFAYPMMGGYMEGGLQTSADQAAFAAVNGLFLLKSYTLFSFMFGAGFAYQMMSASRKGVSFNARYVRRVTALILLGLLHVGLLFQGDILVMYGILGAILFLFRNVSAKALRNWGIGIYLVQILVIGFLAFAMWAGTTYAPDDMALEFENMQKEAASALSIYGDGSFMSTVHQRFKEWGEVITFGMLMQGFGAMSFFLFGFSAVKYGVLNDAQAPIWRRFRRVYLPIGLIGSAYGGWVLANAQTMMGTEMFTGMFLLTLFAPFSTAGYLGLIAKWAEAPNAPLKTFLARGGTASLTAYLMQSLILSVIFNAYGFGLYASLGAAACITLALAVAIFTISFTSLWRKKYARGPMEVLLRRWTYWGKD